MNGTVYGVEMCPSTPHILPMTQIAKLPTKWAAVIGIALLSTSPAALAEDPPSEMQEGADMMSRGFQMLLDGLAQEMEPLKDQVTRDMVEGLAKGWQKLLLEMDDISAYHPPEFLDNGDIIIRRKDPVIPKPGDNMDGDGETEL